MAKFGKKPTDDQMLEGGGGGGGSGGGGATPRVSGKLAGATAATLAAPMLALPLASEYMEAGKKDKREREAAAEIKRESRGKEESMTTGEKEALQEVQDEKMRQKMKTAPTTKTTMAKNFAKGGNVSSASKRADGCAQRGKTRGMMV